MSVWLLVPIVYVALAIPVGLFAWSICRIAARADAALRNEPCPIHGIRRCTICPRGD